MLHDRNTARRLFLLFSLLIVLSLVLSACQQATPATPEAGAGMIQSVGEGEGEVSIVASIREGHRLQGQRQSRQHV